MTTRPLVEPVTVDVARMTDRDLQSAIVTAMRVVTSGVPLNTQKLFVGLVSGLTDALMARDEQWLTNFAPTLAEIGHDLGAEDGM